MYCSLLYYNIDIKKLNYITNYTLKIVYTHVKIIYFICTIYTIIYTFSIIFI